MMISKRILATSILTVTWSFAAFAQDAVKIGVVMGLSGPPAIVDFGESYLQGMKLALKDYSAAGKHKIEFITYDDEANPQNKRPKPDDEAELGAGVQLLTNAIRYRSKSRRPHVARRVSRGANRRTWTAPRACVSSVDKA